jgi:GT2 family glycosyltransferase
VRAFLGQGVPLEVTVLDNDSSAELFQQLESIIDPSVTIVRLDDNKGWGGALNVALRQWLHSEESPYCLISAHDAIPEFDCVPMLLRAMENDSRVGIACPQYPEPIITRFSRWHGVQPETVLPQEPGTSQEIDVPHGTLMLVRRECLQQIGIFDQRYFAYGDEHELGARAVRNDWKVVMVWGAVVVNPATSTENAWRSYLFARNSLFLVHDYFGRAAASLRAFLILANTLRLTFRRNHSFSARARWRAVRDYFAGHTGRPVI